LQDSLSTPATGADIPGFEWSVESIKKTKKKLYFKTSANKKKDGDQYFFIVFSAAFWEGK
jgi:hypothetical protein